MKKFASLTLSLFLLAGTSFADTPKEADPQAAEPAPAAKPKAVKKPAKSDTAAISAALEELRQTLQSQQQQIQQLKEELAKRDRQIGEAREAAAAASSKATEASAKATEAANATVQVATTASSLNSTVTEVKVSNDAIKATVAEQDKKLKAAESPAAIRYKGVTITPGGFIAAETVFRNRAVSGDINTPFTGIPYPGNSLSKVSENNFTGRQSRLSLLAESKVGSAKVTGYYEMDWLGTGVTSNNRQSNSYVVRQRQIWGQAAFDNGWSMTGGQMWSLATEYKKGLLNRNEAIPLTIDPQYVVAFTWARQYGFRVVKSFGDKFAVAFAIEGPQTTLGGRGFSAVTTDDLTKGTVTTSGNFFVNAPGAGGGLFNFSDTSGYTVNKAPDFIFKAALDPGWGHYEVFGIVSTFRNRVYPCGVVGTNTKDTVPGTTNVLCPVDNSTTPSSLGAYNDSRTGGGLGASLRVPLFAKKLDFAFKAVGGDGIGRYGSAQLADVTARPDGTLALIRTAHGLGVLEWHPNAKLDIYAYGGSEYAWRAGYQGYNSITVTKTPAIPAVPPSGTFPGSPAIGATTTTTFKLNQIGGYGSPFANNSGCSTENQPASQFAPSGGGTCAGDIRIITEGTLGFWHKFYQGPKGGVRWGIQYSYLTKSGWSGNNNSAVSISPKAVDNLLLTSFRYYLP